MRTIPFGTALLAALAIAGIPGPARAESISPEFAAIQEQVKAARDRVMPALVRVQPILEAFRGGRRVSETAFGSGVIISPEGYVLTNYHVAGKAKSCICVLSNKEEVPAKLVGADPWTDVAVIRLDLKKYTATTLTWAALGDSDKMEEGDFVLAMGSPFALTRSVTFGIVSCRDRSLGVMGMEGAQSTGQFSTWLQIDALINPGNSGGPLVNMRGEVVGINTRGGSGMGFSVPINLASAVAMEIIDKGAVTRSWIGVVFQPIEKFKRNFLGDIADGGVLVANVDEESPAFAAGLRPGDIVITLAGRKVSARFEEEIYPVAKLVADLPVGSEILVEYVRKKVKGSARLKTEILEKVEGEEEEFQEWGFTAKEITRALARELRLADASGVMVTGAVTGGAAEKAKVNSGDILKELDGIPVKDLKQFRELFAKVLAGSKEKVVGKVLAGGRTPRIVVFPQPGKKAAPEEKKPEEKKEGEDY